MRSFLLVAAAVTAANAFIPILDGGSKMPVLYKSWFDDQIAKQASAAIAKAVGAGKVRVQSDKRLNKDRSLVPDTSSSLLLCRKRLKSNSLP